MSADGLADLQPWQRRLAAAARWSTGGMRNGRSLATRWATEQQAACGEHTHFLGRDSAWCVTRQPIGYLWALVHRSGPRCQFCGR